MLTTTPGIRWIGARDTIVVIIVYIKYIQNEPEPRKNELFKNFYIRNY